MSMVNAVQLHMGKINFEYIVCWISCTATLRLHCHLPYELRQPKRLLEPHFNFSFELSICKSRSGVSSGGVTLATRRASVKQAYQCDSRFSNH